VGKDQRLYLNPGLSEVKDFLIESIVELISNYSVDAIHFNGVFYPKDGLDTKYDDELYNVSEMTVQDFRTGQINELLRRIHNTIEKHNIQNGQSIQMGLSFDTKNPAYLDLNYLINTVEMDYMVANVQVPFELEAEKGYADYVKEYVQYLQESTTNLYIGINLNMDSTEYEREVQSQLLYNQKYKNIKGFVMNQLFNVYHNNKNKYDALTTITSKFLEKSVLLPATPNVYVNKSDHILSLKVKLELDLVNLTWETLPHAKSYVVYRFTETDNFQLESLNNPKHIVAIIKNRPAEATLSFQDSVETGKRYKYLVSVVDYANNETKIPTQRDVDLTFEQNLRSMLTIFGVISVIGIAVISYSSYRILKQ
jgi:hypothetical protein